jgi:hypothetical protein
MLKLVTDKKRIEFMDGYDLYPDKHVLLGYTKEYEDESGVESGVVLAIGDDEDSDAVWNLYNKYFMTEEHGGLLVFYYGDVYASGVYA